MPAFEHPDYKTERKRLDTTLNHLRNFDKIISKQKNRIDEAVEYSTSHYNSDNAEQFNELVINEVLQVSMKARLKNISRSLSKPYFARVDFTEKGLDKMSKYYIGKMSLLHEKTGEFLIVDWHSP